jgi:hypothetical protein
MRDARPISRSRSGCPINGGGLRGYGRCAHARSWPQRTGPFRAPSPGSPQACPVRRRAHPLRSRLTEQLGHITCRVTSSQVIDRTGSRMGQDGQRLSRARGLFESGPIRLAGGIIPEKTDGGCRERPCARGVANLGARGAVPCARRFLGACDQTAVGHNILHAWETTDIMDFI